jgi:hypothetical protein
MNVSTPPKKAPLAGACWQGIVPGRHGMAAALAVLALSVGPLGLIWPRAVRPVHVAALIATFPIGWLVSHLILAGLFYGLFTPLGLIFRLQGRDALGQGHRPDRGTYWAEKPMPANLGRYFRQF